jgi:hypothetical protein
LKKSRNNSKEAHGGAGAEKWSASAVGRTASRAIAETLRHETCELA